MVFGKRRFMPKLNALVQCWPIQNSLTALEREAIDEVISQRFHEVEIAECRKGFTGSGISYIELASLGGVVNE